MWVDRQNGRERTAHTQDGRVVGDQVWTNHYPADSEAAAVDHANPAVGIDRHTYKPVILRFRSSHGKLGGYYLSVLGQVPLIPRREMESPGPGSVQSFAAPGFRGKIRRSATMPARAR